MIINLIQDIATPHNNILIEQFKSRSDVKLNLWYARGADKNLYQWLTDITHAHFNAQIYGTGLNLKFIKYCLTRRKEKYLIVGWANRNTQLLHVIFFLLRRPFNHWTDLPAANQSGRSLKQKFMRWAAYRLLRHANCKVFGVGRVSIEQFRAWGFSERILVNLPIFVSVDEDISEYKSHRLEVFNRYVVPKDGFLIVAGSRLVYDKGYDLLIKAFSELDGYLLRKTKLVIVGSGEELDLLIRLSDELGIRENVCFANWLEVTEFKLLIANSDIFVHPARFDSYGGSTLGMALGVAVIGSYGAGAAMDRINHGCNGFLYEATDTRTLSKYITRLLEDTELRLQVGDAGRKTALQWHPSRGVDILKKNVI